MKVKELREILRAEYVLYRRARIKVLDATWRNLDRLLGERDVEALAPTDLDGYKRSRLEVARPGTINNELGMLGRAMVLALEQGLIGKMPRIRQLPNHDGVRQGFLRPEEFSSLLRVLDRLDPHVRDLVEAAGTLGWRRGELQNLLWSDVEIAGLNVTLRLPASRHKSRKAKTVRLGRDQAALFLRLSREREGAYVFHRSHARPIKHFQRTWEHAVEAIGKPDLVPHDLRRFFAKTALEAGVPIPMIMSLGGWSTMSTFFRYAICDEVAMGAALDKVSDYLSRR